MIPILYDRYETEFTTNGLGRLADCVSCKVTEERNGIYECEFTYPMTGARYEDIKEGRIIAVIHDDKKDVQPFEIYARTAPIDGLVTFYAHHISYRLGNVILRPGFYTSITEAFTRFPEDSYNDCPFTFWTDKSTVGRMTIEAPISIKAQLGGTAGSVLDVYGKGEYEWDRFTVKLHLNRGEDTDVEIRYGKNLTDLTHDVDLSETYTAVAPYWKDEEGGQVVTLPEGIILSEQVLTNLEDWTDENGEVMTDNRNNVLHFNSVYYKPVPMDLSEDFETAPTADQLRSKAQQHMNANQAWLPKENIKISFVALWQTEEYANIAPLQRVSLCDKVNVIHSRLGVRAEGVKVIKVVYNVLLERYDSMELGEPKTSFAEAVMASTETNILKIVPKKSAMDEAIEAATKLISGGLGGHVVFNTNADGKPNEILILDTEDINTAVQVLRINENGIGFSHNGYNGPFNTAWTLDGSFVADYITTGKLNANLLTTGYIRDQQGRNYWNLETGEFRLSANSSVGGKTVDEILAEVDSTITSVDVEYNQNQSTSVAPAQDDPHWETNPPSWVAGYYIWQRTKTITPGGVSYSAPVCISGRDGQSFAPGLNQATIYLYQRAQIKPAAIAVDMTYTFQSGVLSGIPDGWTREIPGGIFPCWVVSAPAIGTDATDTIYARDWSPVNKLVQDGTSLVSVTRFYAVSDGVDPPADEDFWSENIESKWTTDNGDVMTDNKGENILFKPKDVPEPSVDNKFVWAYDVMMYDDGNTVTTEKYILSQYGRDGRGIEQLDEQYYLSTSDTEQIGGDWLTNECPLWHSGTYIWTRSKITYDTGDIEYTEPVLADGVNASNQTAHNALEAANDANERTQNLDASLNQRGIFNRLTHNGEVQGIYLENGRLYLNSTFIQTGILQGKKGGNYWDLDTGEFRLTGSTIVGDTTLDDLIQNVDATITGVDIEFAQNQSQTVAPTGGWQTDAPAWKDGYYIWQRTKTVSSAGVEYSNPVCVSGKNGTSVTINSTQTSYAASASGTTIPSTGWQSTPPSVVQGSFLWTRVTVTYSGGTTSTSYSAARQGVNGTNGQGVTVKSTAITYQQTTNGTTPPTTGTWQETAPAAQPNQYMWTRTVTTYTDNAVSTSYAVSRNGSNGASAYSYSIQCSPSTIVRKTDGTLNPSAITFSASRIQGAGSPTEYAGRYVIQEYDGSAWATKYTSSANESAHLYRPTQTSVLVRAFLYVAGGTTTQLDTQTVPIVGEGATGKAGADGYTVLLTNESHTFSAGTVAAIAGSTSSQVIGYKGATQVSTTIGSITGTPTGMTVSISNNGTTNTSVTFTVTTSLTTRQGVVDIPVTVDGKTFTLTFSWALALTGEQGETGVGIVSILDYYAVSKTTVTPNKSQFWQSGEDEPWTTNNGVKITTNTKEQIDFAPIATPVPTETDPYVWRYQRIIYDDGNEQTTSPAIFAMLGKEGVGVADYVVEFYLSTSATAPVGGDWSIDEPEWEKGKYIWTRGVTTWTDGDVTTSAPILAAGVNSANDRAYDAFVAAENAEKAVSLLDSSLNQVNIFNRLTNNGKAEGIYLENGKLYIDASYIQSGILDAKLISTGSLTINQLDDDAQSAIITAVTTKTQYYLSSSASEAKDGSWTDSTPTWESGKYVWTRTVTTREYADGTTSPVYSNPVYDRNLTNALSTATNATSAASTAQSAANKAQTTANGAATAASNAQTTADSAVSAASTAQSTANSATTLARSAILSTVSVYYRSTKNTTPTIKADTEIGTQIDTSDKWTYAMPRPKNGCYFYTCERYQYVNGNIGFSPVRVIENANYTSKWASANDATYIDGANIYAGSVTADKIATGTLTVEKFSDGTKGMLATATTTKPQYYLSTSSKSLTGGEWKDEMPEWSAGKYIWTRAATTVTKADGTPSTTYSAAVYDNNLTNGISTATAAQSAASTAQSAANAAQATANGAQTAANNAQSTANNAIAREQIIYISKPSGTTSQAKTETWVTNTSGNQNTWTTVRPVYSSSNPVLFIATQRQTMSQMAAGSACSCTTPAIDQTTTIIDGGHITTGTIDAAQVNVTNIKAENIKSGTIDAARIAAGSLTIAKLSDGAKSALVTGVTTKTQYYLSSSDTTTKDGEWKDAMPAWASGKYIWTRTVTTKNYADSTTTSTNSSAVYDSNLTNALSTATNATSAASNAQTTANSAVSAATTAQATADSAASAASSAASTAGTALSKANGAIVSTVSVYYRSTSGATPTITANTTIYTNQDKSDEWEYVMPRPKHDCYFFTCEKYTYANGNTGFSTVRSMSNLDYTSKWVSATDATYIDGANIYTGSITADKIAAGSLTVSQLSNETKKALVKSSSSKTQYCLAESSYTAPTTGWQDTMPTWETGKYLWTRTATTVTYTDDTPSTSYSAAVYDKNLTTSLSTANTAVSTANTAKTTAETANTTANAARSKADNAHIMANSAKSTAEEAHSTAETAKTTANTAKTTADTAKTTADTAQSTANAANTKANAAQSAASSAQSTANSAIAREQTIYRSRPSGTTSLSGTTTWVTSTSNSQNSWTTTRPVYNRSYPVLFVATQRQTMAQNAAGSACSCTTPVIDQTTTVIDGGHITTGTIDAGVVNVTNINASNIKTGTLDASKITVANLSASSITTGHMTADKIQGGTLTLGGKDNGNGTLEIKNSSGTVVGTMNNSGVDVQGSFTTRSTDNYNYAYKVSIDNGKFSIGYDHASPTFNIYPRTTGVSNGSYVRTCLVAEYKNVIILGALNNAGDDNPAYFDIVGIECNSYDNVLRLVAPELVLSRAERIRVDDANYAVSGSFTTKDGKYVEVKKGIITKIE